MIVPMDSSASEFFSLVMMLYGIHVWLGVSEYPPLHSSSARLLIVVGDHEATLGEVDR